MLKPIGQVKDGGAPPRKLGPFGAGLEARAGLSAGVLGSAGVSGALLAALRAGETLRRRVARVRTMKGAKIWCRWGQSFGNRALRA